MILTGIALMYLFSALTAAVQFVATEEQLARVVHWTFGSLNGCSGMRSVCAPLFSSRCSFRSRQEPGSSTHSPSPAMMWRVRWASMCAVCAPSPFSFPSSPQPRSSALWASSGSLD
ncbi:iron chelate uptake ABC transporter family permease subunit [Nitratireductor aquimarinus]|nr:iron chelate uptake ABC transporter family permease subunit [Nitratireductor aquimarinus]MBY6024602.1 iron ABC transporter permease [Nitratireductor sp. DP7N14-4]